MMILRIILPGMLFAMPASARASEQTCLRFGLVRDATVLEKGRAYVKPVNIPGARGLKAAISGCAISVNSVGG